MATRRSPAPTSPLGLSIAPMVLSSAVTDTLRNLIFAGELQPGERLIEAQLAERFGTSRGPIRDAFADLTNVGLLTSVERRGTFVVRLTPDDIDELYTLRSALEGLAVERAAPQIGPDDIDRLSVQLDRLDQAQRIGDTVAVGEADMAFHRTVVSLARHRRLLEGWERLGDQTRLLMQELSVVEPSIQAGDHRVILDALRRGDGVAARTALTDHLAGARRSMIARFS